LPAATQLTLTAPPAVTIWNRSDARKDNVAFLTGRITIKPEGRLY